MIHIRQFRAADSEQTSHVIQTALLEVNSRDYAPDVIQHLCQKFSPDNLNRLTASRAIYVALENGSVLGTASLEQDTICTVFVHPAHHGQGIGRALMTYIENVARQQGHCTVKLFASLTAWQFYEKLHYQQVGEVHDEATGTCLEMSKTLYL